jgi:GlpG protein
MTEDSSGTAPNDSAPSVRSAVSPHVAEPLTGKRHKPWLTWGVCAISILIFLGLSSEGDSPSWDSLSKWGAPPPNEIWAGAYWALLTSAFVHQALWHLAFNLYWLWIFGRLLERVLGSVRWFFLFATAAVFSSSVELAFAGTTGIGLSGVVYAFFGFLWLAQRRSPAFGGVVTRQTVTVFIAWLIGCWVATLAKIWEVGNEAHLSGLVFGMAMAATFVGRPRLFLPRIGIALIFLLSLVPLVWCPWSFWWVVNKAYEAHGKGDFRSAVGWYRRGMEFDKERAAVLQDLAFCYNALGEHSDFILTLLQLRRLNPKAAEEVEQSLEQYRKAAGQRQRADAPEKR